MDNVSKEERKVQMKTSKLVDVRGKSNFVLISSSTKWIAAVQLENESIANYFYVCSLEKEGVIIKVEGHIDSICAISFSCKDLSILASSSITGEIRIWKANECGVVHLLSSQIRHKNDVSSLLFHPLKDNLILSTSPNDRILLWDWITNKVIFAIGDEMILTTWSIDSHFIYGITCRSLIQLDSSNGKMIQSVLIHSNLSTPYYINALTTSSLIILWKKSDLSCLLTVHSTSSLQTLHSIIFTCTAYLTPSYNSDLGILCLIDKSAHTIEMFQFFDCSPYIRSHKPSFSFSIQFDESSIEWNDLPTNSLTNVSIECITCPSYLSLNKDNEEIVRIIYGISSSLRLFSCTIRHTPLNVSSIEVLENEVACSPSNHNDSISSQTKSTPLSSSLNHQDTFSLKWNFLSQVTSVDYRTKEDENDMEEENKKIYSEEKDTIHRDSINYDDEDEEDKIDDSSRSIFDKDIDSSMVVEHSSSSIQSMNSLSKDDSDLISFNISSSPPSSINQYLNGNSSNTTESNGGISMTTVVMDESEEEEEERMNSHGTTSYNNRFILEEAVSNLEEMLRRSERDRLKMQTRIAQLEDDLTSLRFELEWKNGRISELEDNLHQLNSA